MWSGKRTSDLYEGLKQGEFCYVLTSRQMGKSSLMVRTADRLRQEGMAVAVLDLTAIGQNLTAEQWYDGLLGHIGRQFNLEEELEDFWLANARLGPLQRWMRALREVVLPRCQGQVVIFVDEIDAVRSLPFSTDEFFAAIRECYNRRTEDRGVAPADLLPAGRGDPVGPDPGYAHHAVQHRPAHRAARFHRGGGGSAGQRSATAGSAGRQAAAANPLLDRRASLPDAAAVPGGRRQPGVTKPAGRGPDLRGAVPVPPGTRTG